MISDEIEDAELKKVGLELMFLTPEKCMQKDGITAVELVRKKLRFLQEAGIIRSKGINPKLWKFDNYMFQRMDEDDPVYRLLVSFDDVDFDRYFQY